MTEGEGRVPAAVDGRRGDETVAREFAGTAGAAAITKPALAKTDMEGGYFRPADRPSLPRAARRSVHLEYGFALHRAIGTKRAGSVNEFCEA